jgi:hypothetical protein
LRYSCPSVIQTINSDLFQSKLNVDWAIKKYTKDNMGILTKIKDFQRRIDQVTSLVPAVRTHSKVLLDDRSSIKPNDLFEAKS